MEREAKLAFAEAQRRYEEALSPDTATERVAALVVEEFERQWVVFVDDVALVPAGAPLMLSAHGSAPEVEAVAAAGGRPLVNAVCPLVTKVHHELKVRA